MSKQEKRLEALRRNPSGVRPEEIEVVLKALGFGKRSGKGDHVVFSKPGGPTLTIDYRRPYLKAVYVKEVLKALEETNDEN